MGDRRYRIGVVGMALVVVLSMGAVLNGGALASGGAATQETTTEATVTIGTTTVAGTPTVNATTQPGATATPIDSCTVIEEPGVYELTASIVNATEDTCIEIRASDVVLSGNGHAIDGVRNASDVEAFINATFTNGTTPLLAQWANHGVAVRGDAGAENVTVRDLQVTDWTYGIAYVETTGGVVENVTATGNAVGVDVYTSLDGAEAGPTGVTVAGVTAVNNGYGVMLDNSSGDVVTGVNTSANLIEGVGLYNATNATITNVESSANGLDGVYVQGASNNTVANATLTNNSEAGVYVVESSGNEFANATIENTTGTTPFVGATGALVFLDASDNVVDGVTSQNNENWTYYAANDSENVVTNLSMESATLSVTSRDVAIQSVASPPDAPEGLTDVGQFVNATNTSNDSYALLNFSYDDADLGEVDESTLRVWQYDDEWSPVEGTNGVDPEANVVSANVTDFGEANGSVYAPLGEVAEPTATPTATETQTPTATPTETAPVVEFPDCHSVQVEGEAGTVVVFGTLVNPEDPDGDGVVDGFSTNPFNENLGPLDGTVAREFSEFDDRVQVRGVFVYEENLTDTNAGFTQQEFVREYGEPAYRVDNERFEACIDEFTAQYETETPAPSPTPTPDPTPGNETTTAGSPTPGGTTVPGTTTTTTNSTAMG